MQVFVKPQDQPYLRTLLKDDHRKPITYQYPRHIFGAMESPGVAWNATRQWSKDNADELPRLVQITETNIHHFYKNVSTPAEATVLMKYLQTVLQAVLSLNLTKWTSNSNSFWRSSTRLKASHQTKDLSKNTFFYVNKFQTIDKKDLTQRILLKLVSSIFDPPELTHAPSTKLKEFRLLSRSSHELSPPRKMFHLTWQIRNLLHQSISCLDDHLWTCHMVIFQPRYSTKMNSSNQAQAFTQQFWKRVLLQYLPALNQRQKWTKPAKSLRPGDLV